ncbi:MAG TPA: glycosyltransferase family 4 protein [Limnochordales bacterium]
MRIWFFARQSEPFSPRTLSTTGLGGSETALYYVARGLARLGHDVTVLNHCGDEAGEYDGVHYVDLHRQQAQWRSLAQTRPPDVLVLFRRMLDVTVRIPSRLRVFWVHDYQGVSRTSPRGRMARALAIGWRQLTGPLWHERVDAVFAVSEFMARQLAWLLRVPEQKLRIMPNGIDASLFRGESVPPRHPWRLVYTSVPERGLQSLLRDIYPAIRSELPQTELHVFSYRPLEAFRAVAGPGVRLRGALPKHLLAQELMASSLMTYPSNFEELGAIAVLEAMAAGVPVVTSALGVLPELAGDGERGVVVEGVPGTPEFSTDYVRAVVQLLRDTHRLERMRLAAREFALQQRSWDAIAQKWERTLIELLSARRPGRR